MSMKPTMKNPTAAPAMPRIEKSCTRASLARRGSRPPWPPPSIPLSGRTPAPLDVVPLGEGPGDQQPDDHRPHRRKDGGPGFGQVGGRDAAVAAGDDRDLR